MMRVLLVDDQAMIRAGLRAVLDHAPGISVVGEAGDGAEALWQARSLRPDVVVMDIRMPVLDGVHATERIRSEDDLRAVRILILTTFDGDREVVAAIAAGADGFLAKAADPSDLIAAIQTVGSGNMSLPQHALRALVGAVQAPQRGRLATEPELMSRIEMLTHRERQVAIAAGNGGDNDTIGRALSISPYTVKTHLNRAMAKLDARDRGQLVAIMHRSGLMAPDMNTGSGAASQ